MDRCERRFDNGRPFDPDARLDLAKCQDRYVEPAAVWKKCTTPFRILRRRGRVGEFQVGERRYLAMNRDAPSNDLDRRTRVAERKDVLMGAVKILRQQIDAAVGQQPIWLYGAAPTSGRINRSQPSRSAIVSAFKPAAPPPPTMAAFAGSIPWLTVMSEMACTCFRTRPT